MKFLLEFLMDIILCESSGTSEAEELEPNYSYHMSEDGDVELKASGTTHSPIE